MKTIFGLCCKIKMGLIRPLWKVNGLVRINEIGLVETEMGLVGNKKWA